jgi:hypothetical protein
MTDSETRYQRLMELVEAEDASNGEVGCGRDWGEQLPVYLRTCGINISDETLRNLLREHLGHVLMEGVSAVVDNGDVGYPGGDEPQALARGHEFGDEHCLE